MSISIENVQTLLYASIDSSHSPTQAQVTQIARMTHADDARKEIQRMIQRRLNNAKTYPPGEILNTLILIQNCFPSASTAFLEFCTSSISLVVSLTHYELGSTPADREMASRVCARANSLSKTLLERTCSPELRSSISTPSASTVAPSPPRKANVPLPSPPFTPVKPKSPSSGHRATSTGLLTPDPSPPDPYRKLQGNTREQAQSTQKNSNESVHSVATSIFDVKKEDVAKMSFNRGDLDRILRALNIRLKAGLSLKDSDELIKALTLVHHCLYWGSPAFVAYCQDTGVMAKFKLLRQHSISLVRSRTEAVVNLLEDNPRLQKERESRATLMPGTSSSVTFESVMAPVSEVPTSPHSGNTSSSHVKEPVSDISPYVTKIETRAFTGGGYSDVWRGVYTTDTGKKMVVIKVLRRFHKVTPERLQKRLNRELRAWRMVDHENITPFLGITVDEHEVGMVSPYYSKGNVVEYTKRNPDVDPLKMLRGIVNGVEYLHSRNIVHGDIKGTNVMVSDAGVPKLIDFGLAQVIDEFAIATGYTTSSIASSLRWAAPELLVNESGSISATKESDVYAFASLCVEVMTLQCPYHRLRDPVVMRRVLSGGIPDRPSMQDKWSPTDDLWKFLKTCWAENPKDRPSIVTVKHKLAEFYT